MERRKSSTRIRAAITNDLLSFLGDSLVRWLVVHQFTSEAFTGLLKQHGIAISMDGKGCWRDNMFIERLWKSVKYEEVYLRAYDSVSHAKQSVASTSRSTTPTDRTRALHARGPIRFTSIHRCHCPRPLEPAENPLIGTG